MTSRQRMRGDERSGFDSSLSALEQQHLQATEALLDSLQSFFELLGKRYNSTVHEEPLKVSVHRSEPAVSEHIDKDGKKTEICYRRVIVSTSSWALSIRACRGDVKFFVLPSTELWSLPQSELSSREKLALQVNDSADGAWAMNDVIVTVDEMNALMRGLFKDVIRRTSGDYESMTDAMKLIAGGHSFSGSIKSLVEEKHALVQKIVNQQETILGQLSRELHDSVLGNVMLLKRSIASEKPMPHGELVALVDQIALSLREVCQELSPRDLLDCGLMPMLEELCENFSVRTGCACNFVHKGTLPVFPSEVALHIFRIAQECLNNVAKHSGATEAELKVTADSHSFVMCISDNGIGYEQERPSERRKEGGLGAGILRERAELINCTFPTRVWVDSYLKIGTKVTLEILLLRTEQASD